MAKYKAFNNTNSKVNDLTFLQNDNTKNIKETKQSVSIPCNTHYKSTKLLFDSDWFIPTLEKIPEAVTQEKGLLLPEKALYDFDIDLNLTEQFLPYLQIEVLAKTTPSTQMKAISQFTSSYKKEIDFQTYDWKGTTSMSNGFPVNGSPCYDPPQPVEAYKLVIPPPPPPSSGSWNFIYPTHNFPVPLGTDPSYLLPVAKDYIGIANALEYTRCGEIWGSPSYWQGSGEKEFYELVIIFGLQEAKDILLAYDNISYSDELPNFKGYISTPDDLPLTGNSLSDFYRQAGGQYFVWTIEDSDGTIDDWNTAGIAVDKAYQTVLDEQLITAKQSKKITKVNDGKYNLSLSGYTLLLSEAKILTTWSEPLTPTYKPKGEDIELRVKIYIKNQTYYSELKKY